MFCPAACIVLMARITEGEHRSMDGSINTKPVIHSKAGAILQNVTLLLMVLAASGGAIGQSAQTPALTNIVLLPGYVNTSTRPMDSAFSGTISKQHGLVISYDIGLTAGRYDTDPRWNRRAVWQTEQVLNGKRVVCIFTGWWVGTSLATRSLVPAPPRRTRRADFPQRAPQVALV